MPIQPFPPQHLANLPQSLRLVHPPRIRYNTTTLPTAKARLSPPASRWKKKAAIAKGKEVIELCEAVRGLMDMRRVRAELEWGLGEILSAKGEAEDLKRREGEEVR